MAKKVKEYIEQSLEPMAKETAPFDLILGRVWKFCLTLFIGATYTCRHALWLKVNFKQRKRNLLSYGASG